MPVLTITVPETREEADRLRREEGAALYGSIAEGLGESGEDRKKGRRPKRKKGGKREGG